MNVDDWYDEATLGRWCKSCGARSGELCRSGGGNVVRPHKQRLAGQRAGRGVPRDAKVAVVRRSGGWCEACPLIDARAPRHAGEHAHHVRMRSQGGTDDPDNLRWVCRRGHGLIHDNPEQAYTHGLLARTTFRAT